MRDGNKKKHKIAVDVAKCQTCWICMMRCGLRFDKMSNPAAAMIKVVPSFENAYPVIEFAEGCDGCGICARYCPTGALVLDKNSGYEEKRQ